MPAQGQTTGTGQKNEATQSFFVFVRDNNTGAITSVVIPGDVQVGLNGTPADMTLLGRFSINATNYDVTLANKGILQTSPDDTVIGVSLITTPVSGRISLYLSQTPREGELHFVKDLTGTSDLVPIDIYPTTGYTIDGMELVTLSDTTASLALVFINGNWYRLTAGIGSSGGSGANPDDTFVTVGLNSDLPESRYMTGSVNILMTDDGPRSKVYFDLSTILGASAGTYYFATVTADAYGRVTGVGNGILTGSRGVTVSNALGTAQFSVDPTFFVGQGGVAITTAPNGNLIISGSSGAGSVTGSVGVLVGSGAPAKLSIDPTFFIGEGTVTVSYDGSNLIISGSAEFAGQFAPSSAEYLLLGLTGSLPNSRLFSAGLGLSATDGGPENTYTVNINPSVVATVSGTTFTGAIKAPSITASLGIIAQGTATGGGFSGSLQLLADGHTPYLVGAGSVAITTSSNGQVVISGSGGTGNITSLTGTGGTSVSNVSTAYTVSSSIYANDYASYLLTSASSGQPPEARVLTPGFGVTLTDSGPGGTLTVAISSSIVASQSIGANLYASYLLVDPDAEDVNARTINAGSGITFTDGGPGGAFTISSTGGGTVSSLASSVTASVYHGYCTGSLTWPNDTNWTSYLSGGPTNWFDTVENGITRNGSVFTVNQTGLYRVRTDFNYAGTGYIAMRLSGTTGGTEAQRTSYDDNTPTMLIMDAICPLTAGVNYTLEFATKSWTASTWGPSDPIGGPAPDTENMRTGEISIFLIAQPLTINVTQQVTSSGAGWVTAVDIPFDAQPNQTFTGNSTVTIDNFVFTQLNAGNASSAAVVNGTGVQWTNSSADDIFGGTFSAPVLAIQLQNLFSGYSLPDHNIRLWWWINQDSVSTNYDGAVFGLTLGGTTGSLGYSPTTFNITNKKGYYAGLGYNPQVNANGTNYYNIDLNGYETYNVMMLQYDRNGRTYSWFIGSGSIINGTDTWPSTNQMQQLLVGDLNIGPSELYVGLPVTGSGNPAAFFGLASTTGNHIVESFRRLRFDYLTPNNVITGPAAPLNVVTASLTSSITVPMEPTVIQLCTVTSSWTDVGIWAKWSGQSTGDNTMWVNVLVDGTVRANLSTFTEIGTSGDGFGGSLMGYVAGLAAGTHTYTLEATMGGTNLPTINPVAYLSAGSREISYQGATLMLMNLTGSGVSVNETIGGSSNFVASGAYSGPNAWVENGIASASIYPGSTQIRTTSSVAIDTQGRVAGDIGSDVFFFVSGTTGIPVGTSGRQVAVFGGNVVISGSTHTEGGLSVDGTGTSLSMIGSDVFTWISGTIGVPAGVANRKVAVFGGDAIVSGNLIVGAGPNGPATGFTGSLTQTAQGNPFIVGIGNVYVTSNSAGQIILSGSGGGGGGGTAGVNLQNQGVALPHDPYTLMNFVGSGVTVTDVGGNAQVSVPGYTGAAIPGAFGIYTGYTTASLYWNQTGSFTAFTEALNGGQWVDSLNVNVLRNGAQFTFLQSGFYRFMADFNAYGSDAYITLQLSGTNNGNGIPLQRTTYRSSPTDQSLVFMDGIFLANAGDIYTLNYITSGTTYPWTGSNPVPGDGNMRTGEVNVLLIPSGSTNYYSITASVAGNAYAPANWVSNTNPDSVAINSTNYNGFNTIPGLTTTITSSGGAVMVLCQANWLAYTNLAQTSFTITRDGTNLGDPTYGIIVVGPRLQSWNQNASCFFIDFPPAGVHTYTYQANALAGTGYLTSYGAGPASIQAWEMRNANIVTGSTTNSTLINGGYTPINGLSASIIPVKNPVLVMALVDPRATAAGDWSAADFFRNGVEYGNATQGTQTLAIPSANEFQPAMLFWLDTGPTFGSSNQYVVKARLGAGTSHTYGANNTKQIIACWELTDINWKFAQTTAATNTGGSFTDMIGTSPALEISTRGRPVLALSNANMNPDSNSGRSAFTLFRNGSNLATSSYGFQLVDGENDNSWNTATSLMWIDNVTPGSYNYQLMGQTVSGSGGNTGESSMPTNLFLYELDAGYQTGLVNGGWYDEGNLLFTTASVQITNNLTVGGNQSIGGNLTVNGTGNSVFDGNLTVLGLLTFSSGSNQPITGSAVTRQARFPMLSAMVTSPQYLANKANLGVLYWDPSKFNTGLFGLNFYFRALFQPVYGTGNAYVDLYDYNGIINGTPGQVLGSVLTASLPTGLQALSVSLTSILSEVTGSGIFLARGWADPSGSNFINVGGVELIAEWTGNNVP
jgi:hypothetical protein